MEKQLLFILTYILIQSLGMRGTNISQSTFISLPEPEIFVLTSLGLPL
jgi:hypothetical protein